VVSEPPRPSVVMLPVDAEDAGLGVGVVGKDADLGTRIASRLQAEVFQCHGEQGNRDLLAGGHQHVEFARIGLCLDGLGQRDQPVGLAGHGGEDDHDLMPEHFELGDAFRNGADAFDVGDRGAAVFLYDECHDGWK